MEYESIFFPLTPSNTPLTSTHTLSIWLYNIHKQKTVIKQVFALQAKLDKTG